MVQTGTFLRVVDNTGVKTVLCIKVLNGYRRRYAFTGDVVLVSIKALRLKRREEIKLKKGEIYKALLLRTKHISSFFSGDQKSYLYFPCALLLSRQNKILGTRVFGSISKEFRFSKYLKVLALADGISF